MQMCRCRSEITAPLLTAGLMLADLYARSVGPRRLNLGWEVLGQLTCSGVIAWSESYVLGRPRLVISTGIPEDCEKVFLGFCLLTNSVRLHKLHAMPRGPKRTIMFFITASYHYACWSF
jgi:hypothetical protein